MSITSAQIDSWYADHEDPDDDWCNDCEFCGEEHTQCCDSCGDLLCDSCATETPIGTWCPDCAKDNERFIPDMPEATQ